MTAPTLNLTRALDDHAASSLDALTLLVARALWSARRNFLNS